MAIIGTGAKDIAMAEFIPTSNTWGDFESGTDQIYVGFGYQDPSDTTWVNKPTGTETVGGAVMAFPRSAENVVVPPTPGLGIGWKLKEC